MSRSSICRSLLIVFALAVAGCGSDSGIQEGMPKNTGYVAPALNPVMTSKKGKTVDKKELPATPDKGAAAPK